MSFICKNLGTHSHETVTEAKICWGLIVPPAPPLVVPPPPPSKASERQVNYVRDLGGNVRVARNMSMAACSAYIDRLKSGAPYVSTTPSDPFPPMPPVTKEPRLVMVEGLITMIPDGYYAVQPDSGADITFLRINRPKPTRSRPNPADLKVQTQHGPRLEELALWWPSGNWSFVGRGQNWALDKLLLLCADHHTSAMRYARELGRCCRCNCELTDARSRHYGIGPECETKSGWGWVIDSVDARNDERSFETLLHLGLIDL